MEFLEVLRRWMWIFFRVETEWGKYLIGFYQSNTNATQCELTVVHYRMKFCSGIWIAVLIVLPARNSPNENVIFI